MKTCKIVIDAEHSEARHVKILYKDKIIRNVCRAELEVYLPTSNEHDAEFLNTFS